MGPSGGKGESRSRRHFSLIKTTASARVSCCFISSSPVCTSSFSSGERFGYATSTPRLRFHLPLLFLSFRVHRQIKMKIALACILLTVCLASAFPQKDGAIFSNEAIRQAQNTFLIPKDAQIQKVQEGIEVAAYENIKGDESINLFQILGDQVPPEVVSNLQAQVEQIGKH